MKNAIYLKETMVSLRSFRYVGMMMLINTLLAVVGIIHLVTTGQESQSGSVEYASFLSVYGLMALVLFMVVVLVVPALAAGAISNEKDRMTLDFLFISDVLPSRIILGKLQGILSLVLTILCSTLPPLALVFTYGGIHIRDLFWLMAVLFGIGFYLAAIGIFCSCISRDTVSATVLSYVTTFVLTVGTLLFRLFPAFWEYGTPAKASFSQGAQLDFFLVLNPAFPFLQLLGGQIGNGGLLYPFLYEMNGGKTLAFPWQISLPIQGGIGLIFVMLSIRFFSPVKRSCR